MTEIKPFRGLRYNTAQAGPLETLVAPPYDVVDKKQRDEIVKKNPNNIFSVELPDKSQCPDASDQYDCANRIFSNWQSSGILVQDNSPAFYSYDIDYCSGTNNFCRRGFIGLVRLADWSEKKILPHEKTFDKVTKDRFALTQATQAQFSPIFMLYRHSTTVTDILASAKGENTQVVTDSLGNTHRVSSLASPEITDAITKALNDSVLYIADGHHRYTTALRYRDAMLKQHGNEPKALDMPFNFIMTYLVDAEDPGLIVLPTHRILKTSWSSDLASLEEKASVFFDIITAATLDQGAAQLSKAVESKLEEFPNSLAVGVIAGCAAKIWKLKEDRVDDAYSSDTQQALKQLDVVLLEDVVFGKVLGLDHEEEEKSVRFSADGPGAIEAMQDDEIIFYMRPTPVHQVLDIADRGLTMPHKSTFFYPKILTGMVVNSLKLS